MLNLNRIELIGNLGTDLELQFTSDGTPFVRTRIATNERWKGRDGQYQSHTDWHPVVFWGKQAEFVAHTLKKGVRVRVEGSMRSRSWEKDGEKRYSYEVRANRVNAVNFVEKPAEPDDAVAPETPTHEPPVNGAGINF